MYPIWKICVNEISDDLNRWGTKEPQEIIDAAEKRGYNNIKINDETIEGKDPNGNIEVLAEL